MSIKKNESFKDLEEKMNSMKLFIWAAKSAKLLGIKGKLVNQLANEAPKMFEEAKELIDLPDKFNSLFSNRCWIAYESLDIKIMKKVVELGEAGDMEAAEEILVDFFSEEQLDFLVNRLKGMPTFMLRIDLILLTKIDYLEGRYHSVVPLLLLLCDGLVKDMSNNGLFTAGVDVTAWDSIAGHISGLEKLKSILNEPRMKTTTEEIFLPYRHGILHGRDLGFNNKLLAAKCWSLLFCIGDWARSLNNKPKEKEDLSWTTLVKQLNNNQKTKEALNDWSARQTENILNEEYEEQTPEKACFEYLEYLKSGNFGKAASMSQSAFSKDHPDIGKEAGILRGKLRHKKILSHEILKIEDQAAAATNIEVKITYQYKDAPEKVVSATIRLIYYDKENKAQPRNIGVGTWKVVKDAINSLEYTDLFLELDFD